MFLLAEVKGAASFPSSSSITWLSATRVMLKGFNFLQNLLKLLGDTLKECSVGDIKQQEASSQSSDSRSSSLTSAAKKESSFNFLSPALRTEGDKGIGEV